MSGQSSLETKAQLDKSEREHLEDVVAELRKTVEADIEYQLEHSYELNDEDGGDSLVGDEAETRERLVKAVEREDGDKSWEEKFEQYVMGVGYTVVNRLTALRCMEVRGFIDRPVTQFGDSGTTPAAEKLENEQYLAPDEAKTEAYDEVCRNLADEIEILFDPKSPYSIVDPDVDVFEDLCRKLDDIPKDVWRADDVLGWIYEYYNRPLVEALDAKNILEPDDVGPANQFYTPHWVVRMLADNSLGKLYLEATGEEASVPEPDSLSIEERKNRLITPEDSPSIPELCTYLIPDEDDQDAPSIDDPSEIRVIDPACGSGHFLLYAFDILERIWWAERPDLDRSEIPAKILEHNIYGVDIDLRSCQLAAFNLYLKARSRAEEENVANFEMPNVSIVCADASVAEIEEAIDVLDEITGEGTRVREALGEIIAEFQTTEALGSLLDVQGTLSEEFMQEQTDLMRWNEEGPHTLNAFLKQLQEAVEERTSDTFGEQDLRSFLNLLVVLTQDYDVALMNPPYGSGGRMPDDVQDYVSQHYQYTTEYYINFFEACDRLVKSEGRIGMLVPRSFMFLKSFQDFREDFIGGEGAFDFLAELGIDILDNATVRTAGTVVRSGVQSNQEGTFIRLEDVKKSEKEQSFIHASFVDRVESDVTRRYRRDLSEFDLVPGAPLTYWVPLNLRKLYDSKIVLDADNAGLERDGLGAIKVGVQTGDDDRFTRAFWEQVDQDWYPLSKGGTDSWLLPRIKKTVLWENNGKEIKRYYGSRPQNTQFYFQEGATFNRVKESGRRFGYLPKQSIFGDKGPTVFPDHDLWTLLSYANSELFTYLMLTQTTERMWEVGQVSKVPWRTELEGISELQQLAKEAVAHLISKRQYDFVSPYYNTPVLLDVLGIDDSLPQYDHPHRKLHEELDIDEPTETVATEADLDEIGTAATKHLEQIEADLQSCADEVDDAVFDCFNITQNQRDTVLQEIALRTNKDPREQVEYDPDAIIEPDEDFLEMVKDLLLHLTIRIVNEDDDGVVPIYDVEGETKLLTRIEDEFDRLFGEHASTRLAEIDQLLGSQTADKEAYPNLREWLEDDLFDYHLSEFDRTPILWWLTTQRLVTDPETEGFACLVDYHQLDASLFDRIESRYLEPLKTEYREQRNAADQRRSNNSLSAAEQAEAAETYSQYESALAQINEFQDAALQLSSPHHTEREVVESVATELKPKVREFRQRTADRLNVLDDLVEEMDSDEFEDRFSPTFLDRVNENRDEWINALADLETACDSYSEDGESDPQAHHYDLFQYFDDLVGSTHYGSNGIYFMNYYFGKNEDLLDDGQPRDGLKGESRLLAELAAETDKDVELGEEIEEACNQLSKALPSDWEDRALEEVLSSGYNPVKKHGVAINIQPLAEQTLVPESVEDKVL
jgi:hypothetical protein